MSIRCRLHYYWPRMRAQLARHIKECKACHELQPSKPEAKMTGLGIPLSSLQPMDWVCTDLMEKKFPSGKKHHYLCIVDRASGFVRAYKLPGTKTKHVISALQEYCEQYYGPPYILTSDGGPQFSVANQAIGTWCRDLGITHELSSAMNPEGNGEAESAVKRVKYAIAHTKSEKPMVIQSAVHNINLEQRVDMSGCAAELFLNRSIRIEGLATIPHQLQDVEKERRRRSESRERVVESSRKRKREKEIFEKGDKVSVQNMQSGLWNVRGVISGRRDHQGLESSSYLIRNLSTGRLISRSEKHIRLWKREAAPEDHNHSEHSDNNSHSSLSSQKLPQTHIPPIPPISPGLPTEAPDTAERSKRRGPGRPRKAGPRPTQARESTAALAYQPTRGCMRRSALAQLGSSGGTATTASRTVAFGNLQEVWQEGNTTLYRLRNPEWTSSTAKRVFKVPPPSSEDADLWQPPRRHLAPPASPRLEAHQ